MYFSEISGNTYFANLKGIVLVKKRVINLIHGANRWEHTNTLFYNYRIIKLNDTVELNFFLFMFIAYHNVLTNDHQQLFVKSMPSYSPRRTHQFMRENVRTNVRAMSIPVLDVKL